MIVTPSLRVKLWILSAHEKYLSSVRKKIGLNLVKNMVRRIEERFTRFEPMGRTFRLSQSVSRFDTR